MEITITYKYNPIHSWPWIAEVWIGKDYFYSGICHTQRGAKRKLIRRVKRKLASDAKNPDRVKFEVVNIDIQKKQWWKLWN